MAAILHSEGEIVALNHKNAHLCLNGGHFVSNYLKSGKKTLTTNIFAKTAAILSKKNTKSAVNRSKKQLESKFFF